MYNVHLILKYTQVVHFVNLNCESILCTMKEGFLEARTEVRVPVSQTLLWERLLAFLQTKMTPVLGTGSTQTPIPSLSLLVCASAFRSSVRWWWRLFQSSSYIWCPGNCCNHCSLRKLVCASARKCVWGCQRADLESLSQLPSDPVSCLFCLCPQQRRRKYFLLHYWGLNLQDKFMQVYFLLGSAEHH